MDVRLSIVKWKGGGTGLRRRQNLQLFPRIEMLSEHIRAEVAELADAQDLGSCGRKAVGVQLPPSAPRLRIFEDLRGGQ
jgi:hypothetical protein